MKYIIEHMEEGFSPWVVLEYQTIAETVGAKNLILSSIKPGLEIPAPLKDLGIIITNLEVTQLAQIEPEFSIDNTCLLDPSAESELKPSDNKQFNYFLFGGILGDHPPKDRTGDLRKLGFTGRHLDKVQMTTDTAVRVTNKVLEEQSELNQIPYIDFPQLKFNKFESVEMPFRYVTNEKGEPIMPVGMRELIRKDFDKSLDDMF